MEYNKRMKIIGILFLIILMIVIGKWIWVSVMTRAVGSFESERTDILCRRNYLLTKVIVKPQELINAMPSAVGSHFQGEWAIY